MNKIEFTTTIIESDLEGDSNRSNDCPGYRAFNRSAPESESIAGWDYYTSTKGYLIDNGNWRSYDSNNKPKYMPDAQVGDIVTFKYTGE